MDFLLFLLLIAIIGYFVKKDSAPSPVVTPDVEKAVSFSGIVSSGNFGTCFDDGMTGPDYICDPMYSYMPCNIYYSDNTLEEDLWTNDDSSSICGGSSFMDDSMNDDICTDPAYSFLDCNIYHTDADDFSTSIDDSFSSDDW